MSCKRKKFENEHTSSSKSIRGYSLGKNDKKGMQMNVNKPPNTIITNHRPSVTSVPLDVINNRQEVNSRMFNLGNQYESFSANVLDSSELEGISYRVIADNLNNVQSKLYVTNEMAHNTGTQGDKSDNETDDSTVDNDEIENQRNNSITKYIENDKDLNAKVDILFNFCKNELLPRVNNFNEKVDILLDVYKNEMSPKLNTVLQVINNGDIIVENNGDVVTPFPFDDIAEFIEFDKTLSNQENAQQFRSKIARYACSTLQKCTSKVMEFILTNNICHKISWIGAGTTYKFSSSNTKQILVDFISTKTNSVCDITEKKIAEWLRRCGDRKKADQKRQDKENVAAARNSQTSQ